MGLSYFMRLDWAVIAIILVLSSAACSGREATQEETQRLWGRTLIASNLEEKAKEPLDPEAMSNNTPSLTRRVLDMSIDEVIKRIGWFEYVGTARFELLRNEHQIEVFEDTTITPGSNGGWRVVQKDQNGNIQREVITLQDRAYIRNGPGALRLRQPEDTSAHDMRAEAFSTLSTFTGWFGTGLNLLLTRSGRRHGRATVTYRLTLMDNAPSVMFPDPAAEPSPEATSVTPKTLSGLLVLDAETAAPVSVEMNGTLEVNSMKGRGELTVELQMNMVPIRAKPIAIKNSQPPISRRAVDLAPLDFLKKDIRTTTIIGGSEEQK